MANKKKILFMFAIVVVFAMMFASVKSANFYTTQVVHATPFLAAHIVNDSSVVGYWRFERPSNGTFTNDYLGLNNGTVDGGATWTERGRVGGAYNFDGINDYINVTHSSRLNLSANFSIVANVKLDRNASTVVVVRKGGTNTPSWSLNFQNGGGQIGFALWANITGTWRSSGFTGGVGTDRTSFVVGTYDGVNLSIYLDGTLRNTSNWPGVTATTSDNLVIGRDPNPTGNFLNGTIDEVMIWNRTLSASEIYAHFAAGNATRALTRNDLGVAVVNASNYSRVIYDWRQNNISLAVLNMPFEPDHVALDPQMLVYMPFENESNSTFVADLTSNGKNGTTNITVLNATGGIIGGMMDFNGSAGNFINIPSVGFSPTGNITFEIWINPRGFIQVGDGGGAGTYFIDRMNATNGLFSLKALTSKFALQVRYDDNTNLTTVSGSEIKNNTWQHVVMVRNYGINFSIYVDGVFGGNISDAEGKNLTTNNTRLGASSTNGLNGSIDEFIIYNRSLSEAEITAHYNKGITVRDFSTFGNNASLNVSAATNPILNLSGKVGAAMSFDGINDNLTMPKYGGLNNTANFSVELWINPRSYTAQVNYFISKFNVTSLNVGWAFGILGNLAGVCNNPTGKVFLWNGGVGSCSTTVLKNNTWYHVAFTHNDTNTTLLYVNGVLENRSQVHPLVEIAAPLIVGNRDGISTPFNGTLDEIRIYNKTLSADEILSHYYGAYEDFTNPETTKSQNFTVAVTIGNDYALNDTLVSDVAYINNTPPYWTSGPTINSTYGYNGTHENLTCNAGTAVDDDSDNVTILYDWRRANISDAVLNMPMDGGNATFTPDLSSFGNNGTVSSATWNSTGGFNGRGAYKFDGVDDYMNTSYNMSGLTNFTVSTWVYVNLNTDYKTIWSTAGGVCVGEGLFFSSGNNLNFRVANVLNTYVIGDITGRWTHIVGMQNSTNKTIYINGVLNRTFPFSGVTTGNLNFQIGNYYNCASGVIFNGTIDEVRIYNRSLSAAEINALYLNQSHIFQNTIRSTNHTCVVTASDGEILSNGAGAPTAQGPSNSSSNLQAILGCNTALTATAALEGDLYYPAAPNNACINLSAPNITFSGAGFKIFGNQTSAFGVFINSTNVTLSNIFLENLSAGVITRNAHNSTINNTIARFSQDAQVWLRNTTDLLLQTSNLTGRTIGLFIDNSSNTNIFNILFNSSEIAMQAADGTGNLIVNGSATGIGNLTFYGRLGSRDTHIYNFTQTIPPPRQFNLTGGSNLTITNSTVRRDNITTDSNSFMWIRWYVNVSTYLNSTNLLENASINVTDVRGADHVTGNISSAGFQQLMVTESIFNNSAQLNFTPYNFTANSSGWNTNRTASITVLESMNVTISLSRFTVPPETGEGGGGGAGHTGDPLICNATAGYFPINGSCQICPGTVLDMGGGIYICRMCDKGQHVDNVTRYCVDDSISEENVSANETFIKKIMAAEPFSKITKKTAKGLVIFVILLLLAMVFLGDRMLKKRKKKKEKEEEEQEW